MQLITSEEYSTWTVQFEHTLKTDGQGLWSDDVKDVKVERLLLHTWTEDYGELRVYFDTATWDVNRDGLIYTDEQFLDDLGHALNTIGLPGWAVSYSEQGMQGKNYVSLDIGGEFITAWAKAKYPYVDHTNS